MLRHVRKAQDIDEQTLINKGWLFRGLSLFEYPGIQKTFTKEEAMNVDTVGVCCPKCNTCLFPDSKYG